MDKTYKKRIEVKKHPYKWYVDVTFGTKEEMVANFMDGESHCELDLGGSFNEAMWNYSRKRMPLITLGVKLSPHFDKYRPIIPELIDGVKGIGSSHWEGVYWELDCFDEEVGKGLYPVKADWDGKTYEVSRYDKESESYLYKEVSYFTDEMFQGSPHALAVGGIGTFF